MCSGKPLQRMLCRLSEIGGYPELIVAGKILQRHIVIMYHHDKCADILSEVRINLDGLTVLDTNTLHLLCVSNGRYHALEWTGLYQLPLHHVFHYTTFQLILYTIPLYQCRSTSDRGEAITLPD